MTLIGRLYGIALERRLCEGVRLNLAYRWFCRFSLDARAPHHSTFSKNRHGRFREAGIFRVLFEQTVLQCMEAGLSPAASSLRAVSSLSGVSADFRPLSIPPFSELLPPGNRPFLDQLALHLRDRGEDMEQEPARGRGGIEPVR